MSAIQIVTNFEPTKDPRIQTLIDSALLSCQSVNTRKAYAKSLFRFLDNGFQLNREGVLLYLKFLENRGFRNSVLITACAAVKKLFKEAHERGWIEELELYSIEKINVKKPNRSLSVGRWLLPIEVRRLLETPSKSHYLGVRDAAMLAVMVGAGLRRTEVTTLRWDRYQQREERWCLLDFIGKGQRIRTVPIPDWANEFIQRWQVESVRRGLHKGIMFPNFSPVGNRIGGMMTGFHVWRLVKGYAATAGVEISPHDLRRTLARMLYDAGSTLDQIQYTLGHTEISTTMKYIGAKMKLKRGQAAVDRIKL